VLKTPLQKFYFTLASVFPGYGFLQIFFQQIFVENINRFFFKTLAQEFLN